MRRALALPLALGLAASSSRPAPPPSPGAVTLTLAPDAEARWVLFDVTPGNQIRFTATIDGRPVTAILDTGVSYSVLARRFADERGMTLRAGDAATVIGGSVPLGWVKVRDIAVGGLRRRGSDLIVAALPATATGGGGAVDLLVGRDLIGASALDLDYANRRFRLLPSGRLPFAGAEAPLAIAPDRLVYVSSIGLGEAALRPMIVDTGDGAAVTLSAHSWRSAGLSALPTTSTVAFGLAGPVTSILAVVPQLRLGALTARQVEVHVEPAGGFSERIGVAGRIGSGFLQDYRVLMDPVAGRMMLARGPRADRPPLQSTSGLLTRVLPDRLKVLHVMRGGPADRAGWKDGELICSVDGHPIATDYPASNLATWSVGAPGRVVRLGLCDGSARLLTLASFY